ncbi:MAG: VWA domain-containing protein [Acidobacteria bacterium]|nr:VWA domain-containing protein [Acidobacteriota bacterium]
MIKPAYLLILSSIWSLAGGSVNCRLELDRGVLPAGSQQRAVLRLSLLSEASGLNTLRPPVALAIALDRSGSMEGDKLQKAKEAALVAFESLAPDDLFSLVIYDDQVQTLIEAQPVRQIRKKVETVLGITAGNYTALFGGVSQAASELRKFNHLPHLKRLILLSDGLANVGPSSPEELGRLGVALAKEGITITTIGLGDDYNEDLMTRLSQSSDGNTYYVRSSDQLPQVFKAEMGDVFNVVARNVKAKIAFPEGIKPLALIGREGKIAGRLVEVDFNELCGSQEKLVLVEVEVARAVANSRLKIASAEVAYLDVQSQENLIEKPAIEVDVSEDQAVVQASSNLVVQNNYLMNANAMAMDRAVDLADQGQVDEAVRQLKDSSQSLRQKGRENNDAELIRKATEMDALADKIQKEGMTKKSRKTMRTDSYQTKKQQVTSSDDDQD